VNKPKAILNESSFSSYNHQKDYYLSSPHKRAWAHLNFAIKQGNGILLLSGQEGSGKSILVQSFSEKLKENGQKFGFFSSVANFDELPKVLDQRLIIIDDAELLSTKQLQILNACIESANQQLDFLQILLVGSEKLDQLVANNSHSYFRKNVVFSYQLGLMNPEDTMKYAQLQLAAKGWQVNSEVARELLRDLYDCSSGNPELVNKYLDQLQAANELHNVQHIALNRHVISESVVENALNPNDIINSVNDTIPEDSDSLKNTPWFGSKKFKIVGLGYLASILIAILVFHGVTFLDQRTKNNEGEVVTNQKLVDVPKILPMSHVNQEQLIKYELVDTTKIIKKESVQPTEIAKAIVPEPLPEPRVIERIRNKPVVDKNIDKIKIPAKNPREINKEDSFFPQKKQSLLVKSLEDLDKRFSALEGESKNLNNIDKTNSPVLTHAQEVDLQLVTSNSRLPEEIKKLFRQEFSPELDKVKLNRLVADFVIAYEFGDLEKIDNLFLDSVKSNKIEGKKALKKEYKKLFNITQSRNIRIYDVFWSKEGDAVLGKGAFKVTIIERGSAQKSEFSGNIDLKVTEKNQSLLISELFYNYGNL